MSETLTFDNTAPEQSELNADEQESLAIGEDMAQQQETLLAGKYNSTEDLEKAYLELQSKLGEPDETEYEPNEEFSDQEEEATEDDEYVNEGLDDEDVEALQDMAGGQEQYGQLLEWASDNFREEEIELYDAVMDQGDPAACFFAVQTLMARYADSQGYEGELLTGKGAPSETKGFRSQAELVAAMADPRYDTDPAYRQDVINTLDNSDIDF